MRALQLLGSPGSATLSLSTSQPQPTPKDTQLLIRVHAAGITSPERGWPESFTKASRIPGHEFSGVVAARGPAYAGALQVGDEVWGTPAAGAGECHADFALCDPQAAARKPALIDHAVAAALPIPLLTAWEAVEDYARVEPGMRVLVTGAGGAVGNVLVQLLARKGARVVALASAARHGLLSALGAGELVDHHEGDWVAKVGVVDAVIDCVGGTVLDKCWDVVSDTGSLVSIADPAPSWAFDGPKPMQAERRPGVKYLYFILKPSGERLAKAASLIDQGAIRASPVVRVPFDKGVEGWQMASERGREGKVVLVMVE